MKTGEIVLYQEKRWRVGVHKREIRAYLLYGADEASIEVADNDPQVSIVCNPSTWPFIMVRGNDKVQEIRVVGRPEPLVYLSDWVLNSTNRRGNCLFIHPDQALRLGNTLNIAYDTGKVVKVTINRNFDTVARKAYRPPPPLAKTAFDRMLEDDDS